MSWKLLTETAKEVFADHMIWAESAFEIKTKST
jgi:hypothetical protein